MKQLTDFLFKTFEIRDIKFVKNSDLILGIEVIIGETVLEWNLKTYLDTFKDNLSQALSNLMIIMEMVLALKCQCIPSGQHMI